MTVEEARKELEKYGVEGGLLKVNFERSEEEIEEKLREMLEGFERLEELESEKWDLEKDIENLQEDLKPFVTMPLRDKADVRKAMKKLGIEV